MNQTVSNYKHESALLSPFDMGRRTLARALPPWWLFLITGIAWMVVSLIVLRFDYTSVSSIALLFGFVALAAGVAEIGMVFLAQGWWKVLNAVLAVAFITAAIVAFVHPGNTFAALAAVFSFVLVFAGAFDITRPLDPKVGGLVAMVLAAAEPAGLLEPLVPPADVLPARSCSSSRSLTDLSAPLTRTSCRWRRRTSRASCS